MLLIIFLFVLILAILYLAKFRQFVIIGGLGIVLLLTFATLPFLGMLTGSLLAQNDIPKCNQFSTTTNWSPQTGFYNGPSQSCNQEWSDWRNEQNNFILGGFIGGILADVVLYKNANRHKKLSKKTSKTKA